MQAPAVARIFPLVVFVRGWGWGKIGEQCRKQSTSLRIRTFVLSATSGHFSFSSLHNQCACSMCVGVVWLYTFYIHSGVNHPCCCIIVCGVLQLWREVWVRRMSG